MSAFDMGWNVAKMPIVPGSLREIRPDRSLPAHHDDLWCRGQCCQERRYRALFDDPVSGEQLSMRGKSQPKFGEMNVEIGDPIESERSMGLALNTFTDRDWEGTEHYSNAVPDVSTNPTYAMEVAGTEEPFRRRGYATAVYDMMAGMLAERGLGPLVSGGASREAQALWGSKVGDISALQGDDRKANPAWPVRDDLFSGDD